MAARLTFMLLTGGFAARLSSRVRRPCLPGGSNSPHGTALNFRQSSEPAVWAGA